MISTKKIEFVHGFLEELDQALRVLNPKKGLTFYQKNWLAFCLVGIWVTNSLCWSRFSRYSLGAYTAAASCWMFRRSGIFWEALLLASTNAIIKKYSITGGDLVIDDTDNPRSKSTSRISQVYKIYDKKTGGYFMGQTIVFLVLVTDKVTIPVGFKFYQPDPKKTAWTKNDNKLKKVGTPKSKRPPVPTLDPAFPNKIKIAIHLIEKFKKNFPTLKIRAIIADAAYSSAYFFEEIKRIYPETQVITQLKSSQSVFFENKMVPVCTVFEGKSQKCSVSIRGLEKKNIEIAFNTLKVKAHGKKRLVIALKYEGEENYRYLVVSKKLWKATDVVSIYSLRWLVEVFIQDWKGYDGWGQLAMQRDVEGSFSGVIMSLLANHCLLFHPKQVCRIENKRPLCTVGSLRESLKNESILSCFYEILISDSPMDKFLSMQKEFENHFKERDSKKHFSGREMPKVKRTRSYKKRTENLEPAYA